MIEKKAPFHLKMDSSADAVLIETYAEYMRTNNKTDTRFVFVSSNINEFRKFHGDRTLPHPDISEFFSEQKSFYFINLAEALKEIDPDLVTEAMLDQPWGYPPRQLSEILKVEHEITDRIWYNRHQISREKYETDGTPKDIIKRTKEAAESVERIYGKDQLDPWDDFEWGMLNGKLSALR